MILVARGTFEGSKVRKNDEGKISYDHQLSSRDENGFLTTEEIRSDKKKEDLGLSQGDFVEVEVALSQSLFNGKAYLTFRPRSDFKVVRPFREKGSDKGVKV